MFIFNLTCMCTSRKIPFLTEKYVSYIKIVNSRFLDLLIVKNHQENPFSTKLSFLMFRLSCFGLTWRFLTINIGFSWLFFLPPRKTKIVVVYYRLCLLENINQLSRVRWPVPSPIILEEITNLLMKETICIQYNHNIKLLQNRIHF